MYNDNDKEHNNSWHITLQYGFGDKLGDNDVKFEDFPMSEDIYSLDGLYGKLDEVIKV